MNKIKLTLFSIALNLPLVAAAEVDFIGYRYASIGYSNLSYETVLFPDEIDLSAVIIGFGQRFNSWYALEGRIGFGAQKGDVERAYDFNGEIIDAREYGAEVNVENMLGIYNKLFLFGKSPFSPYALLGYTTGKGEVSAEGESLSETENDISFGVGFDFCGQRICGNAEFTRYFDADAFSIDNLSASISYKF